MGQQRRPHDAPRQVASLPSRPPNAAPRCKEQGLVAGSYFYNVDCFRTTWPEHKQRHKTQKSAGLNRGEDSRVLPSGAPPASYSHASRPRLPPVTHFFPPWAENIIQEYAQEVATNKDQTSFYSTMISRNGELFYDHFLRTGQLSSDNVHAFDDDDVAPTSSKIVVAALSKIQAEAVRRGEDPYSSACVVKARAAQADSRVKEAFSRFTAQLARWGVTFEGDSLGWRRRGLYDQNDKNDRLVATKAFRPGDVIIEDPSCYINAELGWLRTMRRDELCRISRLSYTFLPRLMTPNFRASSLVVVVFGRRLASGGERSKMLPT